MMSLLFHVNIVIRLSKQLVISISGLLWELDEMQWNSYQICKTTPCHFDLHLCLCQFTFVCLQMWSACNMCGFKFRYTMSFFFFNALNNLVVYDPWCCITRFMGSLGSILWRQRNSQSTCERTALCCDLLSFHPVLHLVISECNQYGFHFK
jgi:hypothetical protein